MTAIDVHAHVIVPELLRQAAPREDWRPALRRANGRQVIEFRPSALPDWIWLWEGDQETISGFVAEFVRQVEQELEGQRLGPDQTGSPEPIRAKNGHARR